MSGLSQWSQLAVAVASLLGSVVAIVGFAHMVIVRPARKFLRREIVSNLASIKDAIDENTTMTQALRAQLQQHIDNGGHTPRRR